MVNTFASNSELNYARKTIVQNKIMHQNAKTFRGKSSQYAGSALLYLHCLPSEGKRKIIAAAHYNQIV